jgi:hypothetical protein
MIEHFVFLPLSGAKGSGVRKIKNLLVQSQTTLCELGRVRVKKSWKGKQQSSGAFDTPYKFAPTAAQA